MASSGANGARGPMGMLGRVAAEPRANALVALANLLRPLRHVQIRRTLSDPEIFGPHQRRMPSRGRNPMLRMSQLRPGTYAHLQRQLVLSWNVSGLDLTRITLGPDLWNQVCDQTGCEHLLRLTSGRRSPKTYASVVMFR